MFHFLGELNQYRIQDYRSVFKPAYFLLAALLMALLLAFNYYFRPHPILVGLTPGGAATITYFLYMIPFAIAFLMQALFYKDYSHLQNPWLWSIILVAPAIFCFRINFDFFGFFIGDGVISADQQYWFYTFNRLMKIICLLLPVSLCWLLKDVSVSPIYGFGGKFKWQPYALLVLFMLPAVAVASSQPSFLQTYPAASHAIGKNIDSPLWQWVLYEAVYALDFFSIEYFFRGLLIIGLINVCGLHAIVPAACFYCCIHFGKPMPEAVGSFFGAILLGIISYQTRSIWPGLIMHIGVAASLELLTYLQQVP